MKYIFRYTIYRKFPQADLQITEKELKQALNQSKFESKKYNLTELIELSSQCLEKILLKPQQKPSQIIQLVFSEADVPQYNPKEIQNIWQQEKVKIYRSLLKQNSPSTFQYSNLFWACRNAILTRKTKKVSNNKTNTQKNYKLDFECSDSEGNPITITAQINQTKVPGLIKSLSECETSINDILMSQQE